MYIYSLLENLPFLLFLPFILGAWKIKELMLMGFISLLLTVGQGPISYICVSKKIGATWHPCNKNEEQTNTNDNSEFEEDGEEVETRRKLLAVRRILAAVAGTDKCAAKAWTIFINFSCF